MYVMCVYVHTYIHVCVYIYIYKTMAFSQCVSMVASLSASSSLHLSLSLSLYMYISSQTTTKHICVHILTRFSMHAREHFASVGSCRCRCLSVWCACAHRSDARLHHWMRATVPMDFMHERTCKPDTYII